MILILTAAAAMALVFYRAATQAVSIDEATTYLLFVNADDPLHWIGSTNNHVLNTALMRLTTRLFGVSEFTVRMPAMLGAALYISACYRFCRRLDAGVVLRWGALLCLIFSPFIMDYLVAGRGYGMALGFLMTALLADPKTLRGCVLASTTIGLCFASNFSFAFVCAAVLGGQFLRSWSAVERGKLLAAYAIPPILTTWLIAAPTIINYPRAELTYGVRTLRETFASLLESQLAHHTAWLYLPVGLITLAWLIHIRKQLPRDTVLYGGAFLAALMLHVAAFHTIGLLYPWDRTGIFFVPLFFCAVAAAATVPGGWLRTAQIGALLFAAALNFTFLRLDRFEEWDFNVDSDKVYSTLQCVHARHDVDRVAAGWPFLGTSNFYRYANRGELPQVSAEPQAALDTQAFALDTWLNPGIVEARKLAVVWRSPTSRAIIAVNEETAARLQGSACF
jgi:hypothetical protein